MTNLSRTQRDQMKAMMGHAGTTDTGDIRICVSPAMVVHWKLMVGPQGRCEPGRVTSMVDFGFNCSANGRTTAGKGVSNVSNNMLSTHLDRTATDA